MDILFQPARNVYRTRADQRACDRGRKWKLHEVALFFIPAGRQVLNYVGHIYIVPFPSLLFYFESENGRLSVTRVFATRIRDCSELGTDTQLYAFPFGNVDSYGGSVCWGETKHPPVQEISDFQGIISSFFGSEINDDYYMAGKHVIQKEEFCMQRGC